MALTLALVVGLTPTSPVQVLELDDLGPFGLSANDLAIELIDDLQRKRELLDAMPLSALMRSAALCVRARLPHMQHVEAGHRGSTRASMD